METTISHYGNWFGIILFGIVFLLFLLFTPFYKKSQKKPASVYIAFVLAFVLEMFGIPFSMYLITWFFGFTLPEGIFWGHTLINYIGFWGMYIGILLYISGGIMVISGWSKIYKQYWSKDEGKGELVTSGIYKYIRHPQYTGFALITLGMIFEWATIPLLIMWPMLITIYISLARKEEKDMEKEFGVEYTEYKKSTKMFIPFVI